MIRKPTKAQLLSLAITTIGLFGFLFYLLHQMKEINFFLIYAVMTMVAVWAHTIGFIRGTIYGQLESKDEKNKNNE